MNNTTTQNTEALILKAKKEIDRDIRALNSLMEHENTLLPQSPLRLLQRVLKIYAGIKPLLALLANLPVIPATWSGAIGMFIRALDAVAAVDVTTEFKAGRDL
jgi:hypothetical protein